jgi:hypothetical protein
MVSRVRRESCSQGYAIMAQPRIVFEPSASDPQRDVVKEIVNRRNITLPGRDQ